LELLARGMTNKEIASQLFLSEYTVKNHVHRILKKRGARDRIAVVEECRAPTMGWDAAMDFRLGPT
jgi:DNA-binding NarL/FixJ family response regulator